MLDIKLETEDLQRNPSTTLWGFKEISVSF